MLGAEHLLIDSQRALIERPRCCKVALVLKQVGEVAEAAHRIGMFRAEDPFADGQRALYGPPRTCEVAFITKHSGEIDEANRRAGVTDAKLLMDCERALIEKARLSKVALLLI